MSPYGDAAEIPSCETCLTIIPAPILSRVFAMSYDEQKLPIIPAPKISTGAV
jgi:hypothetical protein